MAEELRDSLLDLVSPIVLWAVFVLVLIVFAIISTALMYHWRNYNFNSAVSKRVRKVYFVVSGMFLAAMLISIIAYSS